MKLNKNQRKFFEEALKYFGNRSSELRLKQLNKFAEEKNLILPTSALKQCKGDKRGVYDITKCGIVIEDEDCHSDNLREKSDYQPNIILESSVFSGDSKTRVKKTFTIKAGQKPIRFYDPVYILEYEHEIIGVSRDLKKIYDKIYFIFHDKGDTDFNTLQMELKYKGISLIRSSNSYLKCIITCKDIE